MNETLVKSAPPGPPPATPKPVATRAAWPPRKPVVGDMVWFWQNKNLSAPPLPAVVISSNAGLSLDLHVFNAMYVGGDPREAVRHSDDPSVNHDVFERDGCWRHRE